MLNRYLAFDPDQSPRWWEEHQKKMDARLKKRRENAKLRKKGRHWATKETWEYAETEKPKNQVIITDLLKKLDMELWRSEEERP